MRSLKQIKKEYQVHVEHLIIEHGNEVLLYKIKNISIQLVDNLEGNYNGVIDRLNIISRYQNQKATLRDVKRESNQLLREAKKENDPIKANLLWSVMYATSSLSKFSNFKYAILFLLVALSSELDDEKLSKALDALKL